MGNVTGWTVRFSFEDCPEESETFVDDIYNLPSAGPYAIDRACLLVLELLEMEILSDIDPEGEGGVFYVGWAQELSAGLRGGRISPDFKTEQEALRWLASYEARKAIDEFEEGV
jgi:hypothetical protein